MVEGDVSDLADDAWGAILGGGDQPPMSPADVRAVFSDDILREARAKKPKNLLAVMLRALERAEAALEPDAPKEGAPALGATIAPADAPTVLACVRLLARIVPFVAASVEEEEEEDPSDDSTNDEPADVRRFSRTLWGESEDAPLAPALPWRRHVALPPEERCSAAADAEETRAGGSPAAETTRKSASLKKNDVRLASVGERLLALFCDALFCPGFTTPLLRTSSEASSDAVSKTVSEESRDDIKEPTSASWREFVDGAFATSASYARVSRRAVASGQSRETALAFATRRREVLRLLLAMTASEAMYTPPRCVTRTRRFLEVLGGGGASEERASEASEENDRLTTVSRKRGFTVVRAGVALRRRDVFRALVDSLAPTPAYAFGAPSAALAVARDEQRTTAVHCLLTLLDVERKPTRVAVSLESPSPRAAEPASGALAARAPSASWFRWLDDLFGGLWGAPNASNASNASAFSLFGSMDWLGGLEDALGVSSNAAARNGSGFPATAATAATAATEQPTAPRARRAVVAPDGSVVAVDAGETRSGPSTRASRTAVSSSSSANEENAYGASLASFTDHAFLHDALLSIFRAAVHHDSDRSGSGDAGAPCFEEAAALFLHATRANEPFFEFCVSERARHGIPLVFHLLGLAVRHRGALDKGGFVQCASFAALRVSSSATFAHALAATARDPAAHPELELFRDPSLDDPDPAPTAAAAADASFESAVTGAIASGVSLIGDGVNGLAEGLAGLAGLEAETTKNAPPWRGTHLDAFVYAAHALLTETSRATSTAVANPLLVSVRNLAPFAGKNALSRGSCERLCRLVERYASHALLFAQKKPDAYEDHVRTLAEATHALDACARARGDDAALVASIRASRDVFERLDAMGAESDEDKADGARSESAGSDLASRSSDSSDSDSDDSDESDADAPLSPRRRKPSREWMRAIRSRLSLDATLRLARQRSGGAGAGGGGARGAEAATVRTATVRRFTGASSEVRKWLRGYALGLVLLRETQAVEGDMSRTFAPLFDANRVRLFRVTRVRRRKD